MIRKEESDALAPLEPFIDEEIGFLEQGQSNFSGFLHGFERLLLSEPCSKPGSNTFLGKLFTLCSDEEMPIKMADFCGLLICMPLASLVEKQPPGKTTIECTRTCVQKQQLNTTATTKQREPERQLSPADSTSEPSVKHTQISNHADFEVLIKGKRLFVGIERQSRMGSAVHQIANTIASSSIYTWEENWFVLAFAATKSNLQLFVCIKEDFLPLSNSTTTYQQQQEDMVFASGTGIRMFRICPQVNFSIVGDRIRMLKSSLNLFRLLLSLEGKMVGNYVVPMSIPMADEQRSVEIFPDKFVRKIFPVNPDHWNNLKHLYNHLRSYSEKLGHNYPKNIIQQTSWTYENGLATITLEPIAKKRRPNSEKELKDVVKSILSALTIIHSCGFGHCDIRWNNVLYLSGNDWLLVDLELAEPFGNPLDHIRDTSPECKSSVLNDLYMLGSLILDPFSFDFTFNPSSVFLDFRQFLMDQLPQKHPTIEKALKHQWILSD